MLDRLRAAVTAALAAGATDAEASHLGGTMGVARFAGSSFTQTGVIEERMTRVRVAVGARVGAATTSSLEHEELTATAHLALELARSQPETPGFPGFARPEESTPGPAVAAGAAAYAPQTAALGPDGRAEICARLFAYARREGLVCAGSLVTAPREIAVVTAAGVARHHAYTEVSLTLICHDPPGAGDGSGYASFYGSDVDRLDPDALATEAIWRAIRSRNAIDVEPAPMDVVLCPPALAELLEWMSMTSFGARAVLDGTSLLSGREGTRVCGEEVTIRDHAAFPHPDLVSAPFDSEGTTRRAVTLIDRGVARRPVTDRVTAARLGTTSTGHAAALVGDLTEEPLPSNLIFEAGDATLDELCGRVERGLFVTRFHYVNGLIDTYRAVMTGMTRDGTFLIEEGKLGRAVRNLRFTDSVLEAFSRIGGIGRELVSSRMHWSPSGQTLCPALLVRGFRFTGRQR